MSPPPALTIFLVFLRIGATSFGGGVSGWVHREIVEKRHWLDEEKFFASLTVSQVFPGPGAINIAVYIGLQILGWSGAVAAALGIIAPAFSIILALGVLYGKIGTMPVVQIVLGGLAAVGIAVTASMGIKRLVRLRNDIIAILITMLVFVAVGILQWSMLAVVLIFVPASILLAYLQERRRRYG
jgi:chromate transporter